MQIPLVSVIVPSYNHEKYIAECIRSIVTQPYPNFELIVVDDGSKDNSTQIIKELAAEYGFRYFFQENIGLTKTLNKVIKNYVNGKYIIQLASDDIMYEDRISQQVLFMEANSKFGMSYSKAILIDAESKIFEPGNYVIKTGWVFNDLFLANFNIPAYTCIYRTEVFENVGFYDEEAIIEDSDIFYKIALKYQIGYLDIISAYYRRHGNNTSKRFLEMFSDTMKRLNKYSGEPNYKAAVLNAKKQWFFLLSYNYRSQAIKLFPAVVINPFNKFFIGGCLNLIGLKILTRKYFK